MDTDTSAEDIDTSDHFIKNIVHLNQNRGKEINLSSLTAKYNKSKNVGEVFVSNAELDGLPHAKASLSDSDSSDSESSPLSLAALVAKHNVNKGAATKSGIISKNESSIEIQQDESRLGGCNEENSDLVVGQSSLISLAIKHKLAQTSNENSWVANMHQCKDGDVLNRAKLTVNDLASKFMAANLSDDSDSDVPSTLASLALKHANKPSFEKTASVSDVQLSKPRGLLAVENAHRQHTKSESDRSPTHNLMPSNLIRKGFENETSTSLDSLRESPQKQTDFQFSLGCAIPNSFLSKNIGSLSSSLSSFRAPLATLGVKNSFSDPDVSLKTRKNTNYAESGSHLLHFDNTSPSDNVGCESGRIDLFSAIKSSSSIKINDYEAQDDTDMTLSKEHDDEKIVTLLDTICVDDDMVIDEDAEERKRDCYGIMDFANNVNDSCTQDASFMLDLKFKIRTTKCSSLGKVICRRWHALNTPYIRPEKLHTSLVPFDFSGPSPDDIIDRYRRQ